MAKQTGLRLGAMLMGGTNRKGDLPMIREKMEFLGSVLQQNGIPSVISGLSLEREIADCPLKGAPFEVCKQFEGVFDGVCKAINPDCEFKYDRVMSKGDHSCHWVVMKNSINEEAKPLVTMQDDSLGY